MQAFAKPVILALLGLTILLLLPMAGCTTRDDEDNIAPYIRIVFPPEGNDVLSDIATIRVDARDNAGIKHVIYMAAGDTVEKVTLDPYTLLWNTTAYPDCTDTDSYVLLTATAEDFANNSSSASRRFYMDNEGLAPIPVELFSPSNVTKHSATLSWQQSLDIDFSHYLLRRDTSSEVLVTSDTVGLIDDPQLTRFTDSGEGVTPFGLDEDTDYFYRIWIHDEFDRSTGSDSVVSVHTLLPEPVGIGPGSILTKYIAGLQWQPSSESDVAYYRLHRGTSPQQVALDSLAGLPEGSYSYIDSGLTANTTYYYYLHVIDVAGYTHRFRSEDVLALRTLALPAPVLNDPPSTLTKYQLSLSWATIPEQEDSSWIALYRGTGATVDSTDVLLYTGPINLETTYTDAALHQGTTYRYCLRHRDSRNNIAWSNTMAATTQALADVWGGGLGVSQQDKYHLELTWDPYNYLPANDFAGYTLSREGLTVFSSGNSGDNHYLDTGLDKNRRYQYTLVVTDTSGASVSTSLEASTRDIYHADIVHLEPTDDWFYRIGWLPSPEPDSEFDRYELLRSPDANESFSDDNDDNIADCFLSTNCIRVTSRTQQLPALGDTIIFVDEDTTLVDTALQTLPIYNYVVLTYDRAGEYVRSNIVGDTLYAPPVPIVLYGPEDHGVFSETSILINWTGAPWPTPGFATVLFGGYEIWRYEKSGDQPYLDESKQPLTTINDLSATAYSDASDEIKGGDAYYVVVVRDIYGRGAVSNEVFGFTL